MLKPSEATCVTCGCLSLLRFQQSDCFAIDMTGTEVIQKEDSEAYFRGHDSELKRLREELEASKCTSQLLIAQVS